MKPIRSLAPALIVCVLATLPSTLRAAPPADVPEEVRTGIEAALKERIRKEVEEKDANGQPFKRATFSPNFHKDGEDAYKVAFLRNIASADRLKMERFELVMKRQGSAGKWSIASETLKDSADTLSRSVPGDEEFHKFATFTLEREGLKVTASNGSLYRDFREGKPTSITLAAGDIKYTYAPPEREFATPAAKKDHPAAEMLFDPPEHKFTLLYEKLKKEHAADLLFEADTVRIECDPASCEELMRTAFTGLGGTTADGADARLRSRYEDEQRELRKSRKENPFGGYDPPEPADHRYVRTTIEEDTPQRGIALEYNNWLQRDVIFSVYSLDKNFPMWREVYSYPSEALLRTGITPYDVEKRDDPDARWYDLIGLKGTVDMALSDSETIEADLVYSLRAKVPLRTFPFQIIELTRTADEKKDIKDPQLTIQSIEDANGEEVTWTKTGSSNGYVILPQTLDAGSTFSLRFKFLNKVGIYAVTPTFSYVSRFGWMPFVRFTDPITDFNMTIRVPARYRVLGIGKKVEETAANGIRTTRWVADSPVEFPSVIFGDYLTVESSVKATKLDGSAIPVTIYADKLGKIEGAEKQLGNLADQAANSLNLYRDIFGVDYPYGKLDLVNDPFGAFYGQSPSSLIYLGNGVFLGESKAAALLDSGSISKFNREVVPHEVGHQWWGSLIPNHNQGNYWFVESLAEYSSALYVEASEGREAYLDKVATWRRTVLNNDLLTSVQDASVLWNPGGFRPYQAAVYNKGPYAFHIMRSTWGEEKFKKFLKTLATELQRKPIVTRDIQRVAEEVFGGNMDFFFDQWLRGVGLPEYTVTYTVRESEDGKLVLEGQVDQRTLVGLKKDLLENVYYTAVVPIHVTSKSGKVYRLPLRIQGARTPFKFKLEERPAKVEFNKNGESLAYDVIMKDLG